MGNTNSTVYENLENILIDNPDYFIYQYKDGYFVITPERNYESYILYIKEVRPLTKKDREIKEKIYVSEDQSFVDIPEEIINDVPYLGVDSFSNAIYLGYLYATKSRKGRFMEEMFCQIGRDLGADQIYLYDASKSGPCENFSTSFQLFISDSKKFTTYYENLGYRSDDPQYNKDKAIVKKLYPKMLEYTLKDIKEMIREEYKNHESSKRNKTTTVFALGYLLSQEKKLNMNLIEYFKYLIENKRCKDLNILRVGLENIENDEISTFIINLRSISNGFYYKEL